MKFFANFLAVLLFSALASAETSAEQIEALKARVAEIERLQLESGTGSAHSEAVKPFLNHEILFGGFFESGLTGLQGPGTDRQISANSHILGINISSELSPEIRFTSQFITGLSFQLANPHNDPAQTQPKRKFGTPNFGALVAQAYAEYSFSELLKIRTGLGYVPFGYAMQQREPVLFLRRGGPQLASSNSNTSVGIANPLWMGLHAHGGFDVKAASRIGYDLYTHTPFVNATTVGFGGRVAYQPYDGIHFGYSVQNGAQQGSHYFSHGLDAHWKKDALGITAEAARNTLTDGAEVATSYYLEPSIALGDGNFILFAVGDYLDNKGNTSLIAATPTADPYEKWIYGLGMNWLPTPFARYRVSLLSHDYIGATASPSGQNRDYFALDLSVGVAF
jgi:hypothetical protein